MFSIESLLLLAQTHGAAGAEAIGEPAAEGHMVSIEIPILIASVLILLGIASSKLSARLGVPALLLFLVVGMLAGEEGLLGISFEDYSVAYSVGAVGLALILFDGGLGTPVRALRLIWKPALALSTFGVMITAGVTGAAAAWILGIPILNGLLLGSIVGSTDASAVFSVLRSGGVSIPHKLRELLEVESGGNDPMAIFMTIGCIEILRGELTGTLELVELFALQAVIGTVVGLGVGFGSVWIINRINLDAAGLYPVLVTASGLLAFGLAGSFHGSGFLAVYLAGIVIGNSRIAYQRGIRLFHDASAWLAQIAMFVLLGLLSFPSRLLEAAPQGLLIAAVLVFVARPVAVFLSLPWFGFNWREMTLLSWVGLKGAVPITLAIFPLLYDVPEAARLFNVVFFIVVSSALVQGWTLPFVAGWLGLRLPTEAPPPLTLEISSLRTIDGEVLDFAIRPESRAAGRLVRDLALPEGSVISLIARDKQVIPPHGNTRIETGDHVLVVTRSAVAPLVNQVFGDRSELPLDLPTMTAFPLRPTATVGELEETYGIDLDLPAHLTLAEAIRNRTGSDVVMRGETVPFGGVALQALAVSKSGAIEKVGLIVLPQSPEEAASAARTAPSPPIVRETPATGDGLGDRNDVY